MPSPEETIDYLRQAIVEPLSVIADPDAGRFLGPAVEEFEDLVIALACIHLFERADGEGYARNLQLCGFARQHFLQRTRDAGEVDDVYSAASRAQGDLAAFISGDDALMRDIVTQTAAAPLAGEYEEDFHYRKLLHHLMITPGQIDDGAVALLIDAFESTRRDKEEIRSALCASFRDADESGFWAALTTLHDELQERRATPPRTDEPWEELYRRLWLEGLVWLALVSRLRGWISPEKEYALCPSWGHRRTSPPVGENIFLTMPISG